MQYSLSCTQQISNTHIKTKVNFCRIEKKLFVLAGTGIKRIYLILWIFRKDIACLPGGKESKGSTWDTK